MVDWNDPLSIISVVVPIIGGGIASVYYIKKILQDREDRKPRFAQFQRKKYDSGNWYIFLHSPNQPIRRCNAIFKGEKLPLWDRTGYERTIPEGGGVISICRLMFLMMTVILL